MGTYIIDGKDYSLDNLLEDLALIRDLEAKDSARLVRELRNRNLDANDTFKQTNEKRAFLREVLGYPSLYAEGGTKIPLEECAEARIGLAFKNTLQPHIERAAKFEPAEWRVSQYKKLATEDYEARRIFAAESLENFKRENPKKYRANVLAALRA